MPLPSHAKLWLCLTACATAAGLTAVEAAPAGETSVSELWTEYVQMPDTHPVIPNCSYAGYQYGERPIPHIDGPVYDVRKFGAKGDGVTDDAAAIRAALQAVVPSQGGVVYFPDGSYAVSQALFVHTNRTVLRGQSRTGAELVFTQPLDRAYGTFNYKASSGEEVTRWSYDGGLVWFAPKAAGNTWRPEGAALDAPVDAAAYGTQWLVDGPAHGVVRPARRGDRYLVLGPASGAVLQPGDMVRLELHHPADYSLAKHLAGDGPWADAYGWRQGKRGVAWLRPSHLYWPAEVIAFDPVTGIVMLRQPLRFDVRAEWKPALRRMAQLLHDSGLENLTLRFKRDYAWTSDRHHHEEGWNGPYFNNAIHCWLRDATVIDMDNGPNLTSAKCITLTRFSLEASREETADHHHGTITRAGSHDNLISDFVISSRPRHGLNIESLSTGNVWSRGVLEHGVFDSHRREPFENIRTDITLAANDGAHGGNGGPLMGARFVNWNIRTPEGNNYMVGWANGTPLGAIVGLQGSEPTWQAEPDRMPVGELSGCRIEGTGQIPNPPNLYEAQLRLRLGAEARR
jgi:hypothetical protein